jgi:uncharacterized protein
MRPLAPHGRSGKDQAMECRTGCGACCIAPSISSPIPGMPQGKPAGVRCVQLLPDFRCALFGHPDRPAVCASLRPEATMCGADRDHALALLGALEAATRPNEPRRPL